MLATLAIVLMVLWLLGLLSGYVLAGWIHVVVVIAVVLLIVALIQRQPAEF